MPKILIPIAIITVIAGIGVGYLLSRSPTSSLSKTSTTITKTANQAGVTDTKTFSDKATGTLEKGGLDGEGTHKLIRPGGVDQTVYLVSSIVDLDEYVGKKIEINGQTLRAQHVGWLMDVGRLTVVQ